MTALIAPTPYNKLHCSMTSTNTSTTRSLALFCKVVDNYGDIGICWRLARQLQHEHAIAVTLWVDDLRSFQRICPQIMPNMLHQTVDAVMVRHWRDQIEVFSAVEVADLVIEFFGCDIPPGYLAAMAARSPRAIWLNLEGLSAEEWVEGCHTLPSPHGQLPLTKYFFFPGFTASTGGLLCEASLEARRQQFHAEVGARQQFLLGLGLTSAEITSFIVSLFCYPHAPLASLFAAWQAGDASMTCVVPEGVAVAAVEQFLGRPAVVGTSCQHGSLTVRVVPFIEQPLYDKLLWACDFNIVRGEDSFVRAQWAQKPFIWHIYPQDKDLHHVKLDAFLQRYVPDIDSLVQFSRRWNDTALAHTPPATDWAALWADLQKELMRAEQRSVEWHRAMAENGDLASNLLQFADTLRSVAAE